MMKVLPSPTCVMHLILPPILESMVPRRCWCCELDVSVGSPTTGRCGGRIGACLPIGRLHAIPAVAGILHRLPPSTQSRRLPACRRGLHPSRIPALQFAMAKQKETLNSPAAPSASR
jgi:hypothetical protein